MSACDPLFRYSRQMLVPHIGREGQERLRAARVGLVGCGALGSVIANNLVRAGVGLCASPTETTPSYTICIAKFSSPKTTWPGAFPRPKPPRLHLRPSTAT